MELTPPYLNANVNVNENDNDNDNENSKNEEIQLFADCPACRRSLGGL